VLAKNPRLGNRRLDLTDDPVLFWPVQGQYMVIYLHDTEPLKIVRILQGARNASLSFKRPEQIGSGRGKSGDRQLTSWLATILD
jgi:hypothetical protein